MFKKFILAKTLTQDPAYNNVYILTTGIVKQKEDDADEFYQKTLKRALEESLKTAEEAKERA